MHAIAVLLAELTGTTRSEAIAGPASVFPSNAARSNTSAGAATSRGGDRAILYRLDLMPRSASTVMEDFHAAALDRGSSATTRRGGVSSSDTLQNFGADAGFADESSARDRRALASRGCYPAATV